VKRILTSAFVSKGHSERLFRELLESAPEAIVIADEAGKLVLVNAQAEELFGWSRAELIGRSVEVLMPERFRSRHLQHRATFADHPTVRAMGQKLDLFALDDFGVGFGSFYYLKHVGFDYLKIDGEFVRNCHSDNTDRLVIRSLVGIARGLGKSTIAEWVGSEETRTLLTRLGVDYGQGYHLGKPAPLQQHLARRADKSQATA
jgi:EAL domain/PAS fold